MLGNFDWGAPERPYKPRKPHTPKQLPYAALDEAVSAYKRSLSKADYTRLCHHLANGGQIHITITVS